MENSSPFSVSHSDQFFHQSSGAAGGSSTSMLYTNRRPSGQHPHFIIGGGGYEDNNYNNLPDQPPSSTTFQPGQHVDPLGITSNPIYEDSYLFDQVSNPTYEDSCLFDQTVDQDWLLSSNIDFDFSLYNYIHFDPTPQTQDINHSQALLHGGGVATQTYSEAKQRRQYKRWTHEETSKLLVAIEEFGQSRYLWTDVKNKYFSADIERSANSLKQKFKEMCKAAATSSGVKDAKTKELYHHALKLREEIQQKKCFKKSFTGN